MQSTILTATSRNWRDRDRIKTIWLRNGARPLYRRERDYLSVTGACRLRPWPVMCDVAPLEDGVYSGSRNRVALFAALLGPPERERDHLSHQSAITCRIVDTLTKQCRSHGKNQYKRYTMVVRRPVYFDPETVSALREVLDEAWDRLHPKTQ